MKPPTKALWAAVAYGAVGVILVMLAYVVSAIYTISSETHQGQQDRTPILNQTRQAAVEAARTAKIVESCVKETGSCHKQGQAQTKATVDQLNQYLVASVICAATIVPKFPHESTHALVDRVTVCAVAQLTSTGDGHQ